MFEIPSDLPLNLGALAWLLGGWQGWGTRTVVNPDTGESEALPVLQNIEAKVVGKQMKMDIEIFAGLLDEDFDPQWDAKEGLDRIEPGELLKEETIYWIMDGPLSMVPAGQEEPRELRATSADTDGFAILWAGVSLGPRIQLASDGLVKAPAARAASYFSRMFGLVGGELMWASESMDDPEKDEYEVELTGRLLRTASAVSQTASNGVDDADDAVLGAGVAE